MDKMIHKNEFKLRALLTNDCNLNCECCLNDFQYKPEPGQEEFLGFKDFRDVLRDYSDICFTKGYKKQVYFSGGEPTINPQFSRMLDYTKRYYPDVRTVVCTNGINNHILRANNFQIDEIHLGVNKQNYHQIPYIISGLYNVSIQCVYSASYRSLTLLEIDKLRELDVPLKVFPDFFDDAIFREIAYTALEGFDDVSLRFTGSQINRGPGCKDCTRDCITLKGVWLFPDGGMSPCPQYRMSYTVDECEIFHRAK